MQERYIAAVDLGTSKTALTVARVNGFDMQVIFHEETASDGIRHSNVFNPKKASEPLAELIRKAEDELRIKILQVVVGLPRYDVRQESAPARIDRSNPSDCITQDEIDDLKNFALDTYPVDNADLQQIYGAVAQSFSTEDLFQETEQNVIGVTSSRLEGNFKVFVGAKKPVSNIEKVMGDLGLAYTSFFLPEAVAHAVLTSEEMDNGVALIEIGAGVTSLTIYQNNIMRFYGAIPFGGKSVTTDIKLQCAFQERLAENIKLAFGACMPNNLLSLGEKTIQINDEETGAYEQLPVKFLSEIIDCRMREIITAMLYLIQKSGYADRLRNGVVLTGGGANLVNCANLFKEMSGYNVRLGYPRTRTISTSGCPGLSETDAVASVGMLMLAKDRPYLNCIDEMIAEPAPKVEVITEPEEEEPVRDTLFAPEETDAEKPKAKPEPKPKPRKPAIKFTWGTKITDGLKSLFDETIGDSFDKAQ